ncbi:MAG: hypothetical protein WCF57_10110 [Pyrinomonadaceae bacterium]
MRTLKYISPARNRATWAGVMAKVVAVFVPDVPPDGIRSKMIGAVLPGVAVALPWMWPAMALLPSPV